MIQLKKIYPLTDISVVMKHKHINARESLSTAPDTECSIIISSFYNANEKGSEEAMMRGHQFR